VSPPNQPPVSIVLATYDRRDWLRMAMDSVLDQSYANLELLVMDDGSTDGTPELLEEYARRQEPERFRFSRHENMGQARTLNRGYQMARGEILGYLSDDDLLAPDTVSRLVAELVAAPDAVAAYPGYRMINVDGAIVDTVRPIEYSPVEAFRLHDTVIGPGGLVRRQTLESTGGWDPALHWMGDLILWMRVGLAGRVVRVPEPLASWRRHPGGITMKTSLDRIREHLRLVGIGASVLELPDDATATRAEALRNACVIAAFFGGDPGGPNTGRFMAIDLQRPAVSAFGAGLGQSELLDERASETARLWRELAELVVDVGELRVPGSGVAPAGLGRGGLAAATSRLGQVGLSPFDGDAVTGSTTHAEVFLALWEAAFLCGAEIERERCRYLLIDKEASAFSEDELSVLTNNAIHSRPADLRAAVDRLRRELDSSRNPGSA
jgi:glycosyltransferase involved in cell wall biosynthesis